MSQPVLCPECGWSGTQEELVMDETGKGNRCPICTDNAEILE